MYDKGTLNIMIRKYVFLILLCWPCVSMAVDTSAINNASTISGAATAAREELSKLNLEEPQKTQAEQLLSTAIDDARCETVTVETPETENTPEDGTSETEDSEGEYCPATGNRLKSINDKTKIGDECSSTNIAAGEVIWAKTKQPKTICTCVAYVCNNGYHSVSGRCDKDEVKIPNCPRQEYNNVPNIKTGNDALKFCEEKGGKQCKTVNAIKDYTGIKGKVLCNAGQDEVGVAKQRVADSKLKYYNCGESDKFPKGVTCKFIQDFKREKVTPMEAMGLMKEYALKKYKDDIKCDEQSHRKSNDYRQCASRKNSKYFYEFEFKDLDAGNSGFWDALCTIWGLDSGSAKDQQHRMCKTTDKKTCAEISNVIKRTFYSGGGAELKDGQCIVKQHENFEGSKFQINSELITLDKLKTINGIDPMHFYDKAVQVNASVAELYNSVNNYVFNELKLPVKPLNCSNGIVDNVDITTMTAEQYKKINDQLNACIDNSTNKYSDRYDYQSATVTCKNRYPIETKMSDILTCEYDSTRFDLAFKKLDVKWNRKSTAGYQGLRCLSEGGSFTGKSCTLANKEQCDSFNARFKKDYPNSKGMEWDEEMGTCVLKDAKYVSNVQKVAETTGMVALTLVTAVAGGPVVWALSVVESAALVTEAVTEEKINDWAEAFLVDAARCNNNSICANGVMKKHIARIMEGSKQFNETQNKQIAKQTERLLGMLDEKTVSAIVDKGESSGYIGEDRDPDLEKSIRAYYGTQLTSDEKRLLTTKKVATVATFATLIGGGIMAGLRQSFKHNLIHISKAKQARWLDLKILKVSDVTDDVVAMSKTGQKAAAKAGKAAPVATDASADVAKGASREMTPAQAKKLEELDTKIAKLEAKTNRTADEAAELKKLRQERNTLLNKVGTKDADEIAKLSSAAFDQKAIETAQTEYETAKKRYDYVKKYMSEHNGNLPQGTTKYDLQTINNNMANAEKKLKDLGQEVVPVEPLQIGKKPTVTPAETKPVDNTAKPKDTKPAEPKPAESGAKPKETSGEPKPAESETPKGTAESTPKKPAEETPKATPKKPVETKPVSTPATPKGKWADATVLDPTFDIKVTPLELGGKKYYLKAGDTETLIQNEISRTKQAHELLKHNKIVTSVGVVEDDQTVLKAFMDAHPDITLPRTPDTQYFIMEATHANTVEGLSDAEILGYLRNKPITIEEQNTILSEIQNMNNNGLIHNDIWHNFAIYRDSGGKLHMELMDFGDFTAEDKLLRSNDDVLEIKKLFSKWSDRGLVEKK